jgi:putative FmdB family regulatory protein
MPIYAYACSACGHTQDALQKMSDKPFTTCTACGKETFAKTLTAPAFQLKGSGWYATDFKNNGAAPVAKPADAAATPPVAPVAADANAAPAPAAATPAPAPAPTAAPAPAPASGSTSG